MSPWVSGAHVAFLQNSAGHTLRGPKLQGAQIEWSKTLRGKFAFNLCPAKFWTPQFVPRGVLDLLMCAPWSFGAMQHSPSFLMETKLRGPKYPQKSFKNLYSFFCKVIFVIHCHFSDLYNQYDHFLNKIVHGTAPLNDTVNTCTVYKELMWCKITYYASLMYVLWGPLSKEYNLL